MTNDHNTPANKTEGNRFTVHTARDLYSNKSEYLRAMGQQLTPDVWDAIVARALHDAAFGRPHIRAKAREWFAKYILPYKMDLELHKEVRADYDFLTEVYRIFEHRIRKQQEVEEALAITFGALSPEERATLRRVLAMADSEEVQAFWDESHKKGSEEQERQSNGAGY